MATYRNTRERDNARGQYNVHIILPCQPQQFVASGAMLANRVMANFTSGHKSMQ